MTGLRVEDQDGGVIVATIDRPARMNAIDRDLIAAFEALLDRLDGDSAARVLVLTGAGRAFSAGADLKSDLVASAGPEESLAAMLRFARVTARMTGLPQPVIAAINGVALGGGFALTLAADIRLAARSASFGLPQVRLGLSSAECGISWLLPRVIGLSRAVELILTGRTFDAAEAERIGYVARVVDDDALLDTALTLARGIAAHDAFAVAMTKEVVRRNLEVASLDAAMALEARTQILCGQSEGVRKAIAAFAK